jgi:hypothetical protein
MQYSSLNAWSHSAQHFREMIERHYAKYISTALEDLARAAVVPLVPRHGENAVGRG